MYTNGGTLAEVLALFSGYDMGIRAHGSPPDDDSPSRVITWLDSQLEVDGIHPAERHTEALARFETESAALAAIDSFASTIQRK